MNFKNKRIAITGGSGFLGSHLVNFFVNEGAEVFCLMRNEMKDSILFGVNKVYGNLTKKEDVDFFIDRSKPDIFIHLAAQTQAHYAVKHPYLTFETNMVGTLNVLESLRVYEECKSIVIASSDKTYGELVSKEYKEDHPLNGLYPYDSSKSITDILCNSYRSTYDMPIVTVRPCNIYGAGDLNYQRIIPAAVKSYVTGNEFIVRNGGEDIREYIHVDDVVSAYSAVIDYGYDNDKYLTTPSFNVSSGDKMSTLDLFHIIQKTTGLIKHSIEKNKNVEIKNQAMNSDLLKLRTGWKPKHTLESSIKDVVQWYMNRLSWGQYENSSIYNR
jgi:CDP-glucose 4,6-dehydratase